MSGSEIGSGANCGAVRAQRQLPRRKAAADLAPVDDVHLAHDALHDGRVAVRDEAEAAGAAGRAVAHHDLRWLGVGVGSMIGAPDQND